MSKFCLHHCELGRGFVHGKSDFLFILNSKLYTFGNAFCITLIEVEAPSNYIAGRPKAALLFWFFGDFRCGVPLLIVILVINKYKDVKC